MRRSGRVVVVTAVVGVALWWLQGPAAARLPVPTTHAALVTLVDTPDRAAMTALRIVALVLAWYIATTTVLGALSHALGLVTLSRILERVSPAMIRRIVAGTAGLAASLAPLAPAGASPLPPPAASPPAGPPTSPGGTATLHLAGPATATLHLLTTVADTDTAAAAEDVAVVPIAWTVAPGDDLWSIAAQILHTSWGRAADTTEIASYWMTLIDANRDRFVVPGDPDLIFAGQVLVVPPVPSP